MVYIYLYCRAIPVEPPRSPNGRLQRRRVIKRRTIRRKINPLKTYLIRWRRTRLKKSKWPSPSG
jgi:hypothetical protein